MSKNTRVFLDDTGVVVVEAEGQEIQVNPESAKSLAISLCGLFNWKIKPSDTNFQSGFVGIANASHTKDGKVI